MSVGKKHISSLASSRFVQQHLFFILHNHCQTIRELTQVHAQITIHGFTTKKFILVKLLALYSVFNNVDAGQKLFDQVVNPSCALWNQIIKGHSVAGNPKISVELFKKMEHCDAHPDGYTYTYVTNGCTRGGLLAEGEQVHGKILKSGICSNVYVCTSLVDLYVKTGGVEKGAKLFDEMPEKNVVTWNTLLLGFFRMGDTDGARRVFEDMPSRSTVSWTTMIAGCEQNGRSKEALTLFHQMQLENIEFDQVTLVSVLSACADLGDLNLGRWIHSYVIEYFTRRKQQRLLISLQNSLMHMYASCGEIESAYRIFMDMKQRTTVSWTSMITGFAKHGYGDKALSIFQRMRSAEGCNSKPDEITFLGVLCACSHSGYVEMGRQYFHNMIDTWGIHPKIEHFGCMVDLYSRAGLLDEAHELVKSMPMKPNDVIWGALLGGCRIHRNIELASDAANWLIKEVDPDCGVGYFVLLSNVYASCRKWHEVVNLRQKIVNANTTKPPGRSWIQIGESIYEFVAGDRSHENATQIYKILDGMTMESRYLGDSNQFIEP